MSGENSKTKTLICSPKLTNSFVNILINFKKFFDLHNFISQTNLLFFNK